MKLVLIGLLVSCIQVYAELQASEQPLNDVDVRLGSTSLNLNLLAPEHEVTAEDELLIQKLTANPGRSAIAELISNTLEGFRPIVINGNDDIPPLDPFQLDQIGPFEYMMTGIRVTGEANHFRVDGLGWYVVDRVTFNALRLSLGIGVTVPWITVSGTYDARASVLLVSHSASGIFRVFINRLDVGVDMRLGTNLWGGHLILRELDIKIDIHDTIIQITGMTGSSFLNNLISNTVQAVTQDVIQSQLENVSTILSESLFDVINEALSDFTLGDLLG